jgi:hypothetical protein
VAEIRVRNRKDLAALQRLLDAIKVLKAETLNVTVTGPEDLLRELGTSLNR